MADFVDARTRSMWMGRVRQANTDPEVWVRSALHRLGFRFRLHVAGLPGRPDIVLPAYRVCVFVHGCFWHHHPHCRFASLPSSRRGYWTAKFRRNAERDSEVQVALAAQGWRVLVLWECGLKRDMAEAMAWLLEEIHGGCAPHSEWPEMRS